MQTIRQVLARYPDGLQAFEVRRLVERELNRKGVWEAERLRSQLTDAENEDALSEVTSEVFARLSDLDR